MIAPRPDHSTSTVHQPRHNICSHWMWATVGITTVAGESGSQLCSILRPTTTPMLLPKQIPTRPLHPLMWIGVVVVLVVIALLNGCGV